MLGDFKKLTIQKLKGFNKRHKITENKSIKQIFVTKNLSNLSTYAYTTLS